MLTSASVQGGFTSSNALDHGRWVLADRPSEERRFSISVTPEGFILLGSKDQKQDVFEVVQNINEVFHTIGSTLLKDALRDEK